MNKKQLDAENRILDAMGQNNYLSEEASSVMSDSEITNDASDNEGQRKLRSYAPSVWNQLINLNLSYWEISFKVKFYLVTFFF